MTTIEVRQQKIQRLKVQRLKVQSWSTLLRRVGIAPPLLLLAFALPVPQDGAIAGLPSLCLFHQITHLPCPGCGLTRSIVCAAHGLWSQSFAYHPLGLLIFAALLGLATTQIMSALWPRWRIAWPPRAINFALCASALSLAVIWGARLVGMIPSPP